MANARTTEISLSRRAALQHKRRAAKPRRTWADRLTSWWALAAAVAVLAVIGFAAWAWPAEQSQANIAAMQITADDFPPQYITKDDVDLRSVAIPDSGLPDQKFDPARCGEFASKSPFENIGDTKVIIGVRRFFDTGSDNTMNFGVVDRIVPWDEFDAFTKSCAKVTYTYKLGDGSLALASYPPPNAPADQAVGYTFEATAKDKDKSLNVSMIMLLAHVRGRTVIAGLTNRSLRPSAVDKLPDREAFAKLYTTLVQRVKDNS